MSHSLLHTIFSHTQQCIGFKSNTKLCKVWILESLAQTISKVHFWENWSNV